MKEGAKPNQPHGSNPTKEPFCPGPVRTDSCHPRKSPPFNPGNRHDPTRWDQFRLNPTKIPPLKNIVFRMPAPSLFSLFPPVKRPPIRVHPCPPAAPKSDERGSVVERSARRNPHAINVSRAKSCPIVVGVWHDRILRCSVPPWRDSLFPGPRRAPRYSPWFALSNPPEYRIGIPRRCNRHAALSLSLQSSQELLKKQFDRIGNRMDHLMIVMAAGKTLVVSSDARGNEVVGCKKLVTRTGVQQPATKPKRQQLYFTHATPLEK